MFIQRGQTLLQRRMPQLASMWDADGEASTAVPETPKWANGADMEP